MATRSTNPRPPPGAPGAQKPPPIVIPSDPLARQRRKLELKRRLAVLRDAERLEQSFKAFVIDAWPVIEPGRPLAWNWHLDVLCETLEAIARGEVRRAVINVPPRTMKSTLFNVMFPAWVWTFKASHQFLNISTDADLAMRDSTVSRVIIQSDWYQQRWGRRFRFSSDQNQKSWYKNDQNGHRQALGMTSKITGKGADCLPAGTMVTTEQGDIDIADLVRLLDPPRVLSFNHETGATEWRRVVASREVVADGLVEVESVCGRKVRSTRDHRFYVEGRGYRPAQDLAGADGVIGIAGVRGMQWPGDGRVDAMPRLLPENAEGDGRPALLKLFDGVRQAVLRIRKNVAARRRGRLLLKSLHGIGAQGRLCSGQSGAQGGEVAAHLNAQAARQDVSALQCAVSASIQPDSALLAGLCGQGAFSAHGRAWQLALQGWAILCQVVRPDAPADLGAGWRSMRRMWRRGVLGRRDDWKAHREAVQSGHSPHQRGRSGQYAREPDRSLPAVSHGAPQIEGDAVRLVRPVHCGKVVVYDIQVEGPHNFFANGILVHNCIIIDDPHNVSGAQSDAERKADTSKYDNEIQNRLNDQATGSIIIIMQRLHEQDLTGHVLPRGGWLHLCFPMEFDSQLATEGVDERTEHGALLWPERFPRRSIDELKSSMTPYAYSGQYQQRPTPAEGGILKRAWWQAWPKERALPPCAFIIQCWDGAFDAKTANDYTACTVWGVFKNEQTHRHNLILLERFRQRVEFPDLRMRAKELYDRHDADLVLIEPKATGKPLVQELRRVGVPVQEWQPERGAKGREVDKTARTHAAAIVPWGGAVWYPVKKTGEPFGWVNEVIEECASFPNAAHDDLVDTCFRAGTMIVTSLGLVPIENVQPGDMVLTHRGRYRRVTRVGSRIANHVYRIKAKTLDAVYVTGEHPFWAVDVASPGNGARSCGEARWVDAADLRPRLRQTFMRKGRPVSQPRSGVSYDALTLPRLTGDRATIDVMDFCQEIDVIASNCDVRRTHGKAKPVRRHIALDRDAGWLFGLFLAEGHSDGAGHIRWACDEPSLREAERIIAAKFGTKVSWGNGGSNHVITLSRSILSPLFATFGHLAENKIVPTWAMEAGDDFARGLIDGMACGDGYRAPDGRVRITTTSLALAWQTRLLLGRIGVHGTVAQAKKAGRRRVLGKECNCLDVYTVDYRIDAERSAAVWGVNGEVGYWIEEHSRSAGEISVYNISVDEDESYVTTGGAVHNCTMAWLYLRRSWWADLSDEEVDERKDEEEEAYEDDKIRSYG